MKLTKKNSPIKIKEGADFKIFKTVIEGYNVNGISILHPDAMGLEGEEAFEFMDTFFKETPSWRDNAVLETREVNGKSLSFIQIKADLVDTDY
tara:strand:+ start:121 stop:399 length:279 start_codon:yes stop_codon:yes gene_type:complete